MPKRKDAKREATPEELDLQQRIQDGDNDAIAEFIELAEVYLSRLLSKHQQHHRYSAEDLAQDVRLALCREARRWDPTIASTSTFFGWCVRGRLLDAIRNSSPAGTRYRGEPPEDLPRISQLSLYEQHNNNHKGISEHHQNPAEPADTLGESEEEGVDMNDVLETLRESQQLNVLADYAMGETMKQVGKKHRLSESRVSQKITQIRDDPGLHKRILHLMGKDIDAR